MGAPRWPLWGWGLQLLPAALLVFFAFWRLAQPGQATDIKTLAVLAFGLLWSVAVIGVLIAPRGRRWLVVRRLELSLLAVSLLFSVIVIDIGLTVGGVVPKIEEQRARSIAYSFGRYTKHRLVTKDILVENGDPIHINERGFRGQRFHPEKRPETVRIVFLGGSQVFGYASGNWPELAGEKLRAAGHDVEVLNAAVPGHTTFDSLGKLLTDVWTLQPDIVVLCQAWNDIKYFSSISPAQPYRGLAPTTSLALPKDWRLYPSGMDGLLVRSSIYRNFRWGITQLLYSEEGARDTTNAGDAIRNESAASWGPQQYRLNVTAIAGLSESIGADLVICKQAKLATAGGSGDDQERAMDYGLRNTGLAHDDLMRAFERTYAVIDGVSRTHDIRIADMDAALSGRGAYFRDGVHFNAAGGGAASDVMVETLSPIVSRSSNP